MPAAQKRRPARAGRRPMQAAPPSARAKNAGMVGTEGRAGAAPKISSESSVGAAPGRPRAYETPEDLREAVEAYFVGISRTVDAVELVDSGKKDGDGHVIYERVPIKNDLGEVIRVTEFVLPPTVTDLCLFLGITRQTWANYAGRDGYRAVVERAKAKMTGYLERELLTRKKGLQGVIFNLTHNHDWKDRREEPKPIDSFDLSQMTDEQLWAMVAQNE